MEIWNNYKKEKLLNSGIYTNIYQAKNIKLGNYVAIKEINKKKYNKLTNHSFKKEEIIKNININDSIKLIEIIDSKENFYIIMNLCLINLDEYIKIREQPLSINEIREILIQINELIIKLKNKNQLIIESSNILINIDTINKISIKLTKSIKLNNELQSETNQIKLEDNNLLNLGILIYYMLFKEYPSNDIILKKKELKIKEIKNNELKDLLNKLFKINSNKTISWEEYFNHSFFKKTIFPKFYFICKFHSKLLNYYCIKCKYNICDNCLNNHKLHEIISFKEIGINDSEKKEFEELIKKMNNNIEKLNMMKREMEEFLDDIKLISGNCLIFENEKKNDYKKYYINCLKIINNRITIEDTINIINLKNYILCNYDIKKEKLHKNIQIINYMDEKKKKQREKENIIKGYKNNTYDINFDEIIKNCVLYLNDNKIAFSTKIKFTKTGNYEIKIFFKKSIKDISFLFYDCVSLTSLNFSNFLSYNIKNMRSTLNECSSLTSLNLSNFNTINIVNMRCFFRNCSSLKYIDISNFNTNNVIDMASLFNGCSSLTSLNLSNFNTNKVTDMSYMFSNCSSLTSFDLSNFNTNNVTDMSFMFSNCSSLKSLNLCNFNTNKVVNMVEMFGKCISLIDLNISTFITNNVTNIENMFYECSSLKSLDISNFNTEKVTNMCAFFYHCSLLSSLNLSNIKTNKVTNMSWMLSCNTFEYINLSSFNTINVTDMSKMFKGCINLKFLNLSNFNTENVKDMNSMFEECVSLKDINLTNFNTKNVKDVSFMFNSCKSLLFLDISHFNTININKMNSMFENCSSLIKLNLSNFNIINISNMNSMFKNCSSLKKLNIPNYVDYINDIEYIFEGINPECEIICKNEKYLLSYLESNFLA